MSARMFPMRAGGLLVIGVAVALVTAAQTSSLFGWAPVRWAEVNAQARVCLFLSGPLVCAIGAWGSRINTTVVTAQAPGRPWRRIVTHHLKVLGTVTSAGYAAGLAPALVLASRRSTAGGPDIVVLASGFAGLLVFLTLGYAIGSFIRFPISSVGALAAGFFCSGGLMLLSDVLTSAGLPLSLFSVIPFWAYPLARGAHEVDQIAAFRLVFLAGAAVSLSTVLPHLLDLRRDSRRTRVRKSASTLGPVTVLALVAVIAQPSVAVADRSPDIICRQIVAGSLCMYAEEAELLPAASGVIDSTTGAFGSGVLSGRFTSVRAGQVDPPLHPDDLQFVPQVDEDEQWFIDSLKLDTARGISGSFACSIHLQELYGSDYMNRAPLADRDAAVAIEMVAQQIAERVGVATTDVLILPSDDGASDFPETTRVMRALGSMTNNDLQDWVSDHADGLQSCALDLDEFAA